jgi:ABC-type phosphate transport system substrate-binding protein
VSTSRGSALLIIVAGALLLGGCRDGSGSGAEPGPAVTSSAPTSVAAARGSTAVDPAGARLDEIDATVDRIERELDDDAGR